MEPKQIIVMRKYLRRGEEMAQATHAVMAVVLSIMNTCVYYNNYATTEGNLEMKYPLHD